MAKLSTEQKVFIIERLACFDTPSEVRDAFKEAYGFEPALSGITRYDPTTAGGAGLHKKLKALFETARENFITKTSNIPIANKSYRLRQLQALYQRTNKNTKLAAALLEQGAKDAGGAFTNKRELTGAGGGPIEHQVRDLNDFYKQG